MEGAEFLVAFKRYKVMRGRWVVGVNDEVFFYHASVKTQHGYKTYKLIKGMGGVGVNDE